VIGGLVMLAVNLVIIIATFGLGFFLIILITQPICVVWAAVAANTHNSKLYGYVQGG
jgi:hypothetical protein